MAMVRTGIDKEYLELYKGFDVLKVGPGTDPSTYASDQYAKKKIKDLYIGSLATCVYAGSEHDLLPLILPIGFEPAYNTVLGFNVNYVPVPLREAIIRYVLISNQNRIRDNLPIIVDYNAMKRAIPKSQYVVRRYKTTLLNVREVYPLLEWTDAVRNSGTRWQNHYRLYAKAKK